MHEEPAVLDALGGPQVRPHEHRLGWSLAQRTWPSRPAWPGLHHLEPNKNLALFLYNYAYTDGCYMYTEMNESDDNVRLHILCSFIYGNLIHIYTQLTLSSSL